MKAEFENLENRLAESMQMLVNEIEAPKLSVSSRKLVLRRKKRVAALRLPENLWNLFHSHLRACQLGASVLIFFCGFLFYTADQNRQSAEALIFDRESGLSIANNTISVNSSTMLTCIPTMVIRN